MDYKNLSKSAAALANSPWMQELHRLLWLWFTLDTDVRLLEKSAEGEESRRSFYRRQYIRAASALVEGFTSMLKQDCLLNPDKFSPEELLLLKEHEPALKDSGDIYLRDKFIPIETNICFAFRAYAKCSGVHFKLDCSKTGWSDFKKLISIRNRITHPRKNESLIISDEEMRSVKSALQFISDSHKAVKESIQRKMLLDGGIPEDLIEPMRDLENKLASEIFKTNSEEEREALHEKHLKAIYELIENMYKPA